MQNVKRFSAPPLKKWAKMAGIGRGVRKNGWHLKKWEETLTRKVNSGSKWGESSG